MYEMSARSLLVTGQVFVRLGHPCTLNGVASSFAQVQP
jgi:hypothetical protein